jgi:D-inositol-3-phosphate glycosyltransferase
MGNLSGGEPTNIVAIPCGVDLDLFRPIDRQQAKAQLGLENQRVVLFVGRLVPLKGVDILIEAASRMVPAVPNLKLIIVGGTGESDPELGRLRHLTDELDLDGHVTFQTAVPQHKLPTYYSAADVCAVPSHYESFCLVATEALACGTPVVASKVGGLPAIIREGHNGLLVPWRCPQEFSEKIASILTDPNFAAELRSQARPSVGYLSWTSITNEISRLYRSLLDAPAPALSAR